MDLLLAKEEEDTKGIYAEQFLNYWKQEMFKLKSWAKLPNTEYTSRKEDVEKTS